jgi:ankyrin repeat protein
MKDAREMKDNKELKKLKDIVGLKEWLSQGTDLDIPIDAKLVADNRLDDISNAEYESNNMRIGGKTALTYACSNNLSELVKLLLDNGANPNIPDSEGNYPLLYSILRNDLDSLHLLLNKNLNLELTSQAMRMIAGPRGEPVHGQITVTMFEAAINAERVYSNFGGFDTKFMKSSDLSPGKITKTQQALLSYIYEKIIMNGHREIEKSTFLGKDISWVVQDYLDSMRNLFLGMERSNLDKRIFILHCKEAKKQQEKDDKLALLCQLPMAKIEEMLETAKPKALTPAFSQFSSSSSSSSNSSSASTQNLEMPKPKNSNLN